MQAGGDPGGLQLWEVLGQRREERVASGAVHGAHAPQMAVELASGEEVGEGELVQDG